jgi:hypothetical protein
VTGAAATARIISQEAIDMAPFSRRATTADATTDSDEQAAPEARVPAQRTISAALQPMMEALKTVPTITEDPTPRMMAAMLLCEDPGQWESMWSASHFQRCAGRRCRVQAIRWAESSFDGALPFYLICDVVWLDGDERGETDVLTVSSEMAMAQLLGLHTHGNLPWDVEIWRSPKPARSGFFPMRLLSLGRPVGSSGEAA